MTVPAAPPSNRNLLWLIFGALMLIAGLQTEVLDRSAKEFVGQASLVIAGMVFAVRLLTVLLKQSETIPSPLTDRTNKEMPLSERK